MNKKAMAFIVIALSLFLVGAVSANDTLENNVQNDMCSEQTGSYHTTDNQDVQTIDKSSSESTQSNIKTSSNNAKSDIEIEYKKVKAYSSQNVTVSSIEGFVNACKSATKSVGAFDDLDRGQAENDLFGTGDTDYLHFDSVMAGLLKNNSAKYSKYSDYDSSYASEYASYLTELDALNYTIQERVNMYNPMYYLCDYYEGSGTSTVAKYWRINSGIEQGDTALTVEANLALALNQSSDVKSVEFSAVWGQGHTQAERTGSSSTNFINWINECLN